jgi:hypothetical protein
MYISIQTLPSHPSWLITSLLTTSLIPSFAIHNGNANPSSRSTPPLADSHPATPDSPGYSRLADPRRRSPGADPNAISLRHQHLQQFSQASTHTNTRFQSSRPALGAPTQVLGQYQAHQVCTTSPSSYL